MSAQSRAGVGGLLAVVDRQEAVSSLTIIHLQRESLVYGSLLPTECKRCRSSLDQSGRSRHRWWTVTRREHHLV